MVTINLKTYYPHYESDEFVEVTDELFLEMQQWERNERSRDRKRRRYRDFYPMSFNDEISTVAVHKALSAADIYEQITIYQQLYDGIAALSEKQAMRIYAYYFKGMNKRKIAEVEGVSQMAVGIAIRRGLLELKHSFGKISEMKF